MLSALEKNWYIWTTKEKNSDELGIRGICEKGLNPNSLLSPLQALFLLKLDITDNLLWEYHVIKKTAWLQVNGNILKEKTIWSYLERLANRWSIYSYIKLKLNIYVQRRQWHPTPVLLPGKSHGWRSLVGYKPWGCYESDTTERLHFHFLLSCIGEGNGNPLQCSCLENHRDGGAWWAAVYGVTQSQTRLKWLSSSSSKYLCYLSFNWCSALN